MTKAVVETRRMKTEARPDGNLHEYNPVLLKIPSFFRADSPLWEMGIDVYHRIGTNF